MKVYILTGADLGWDCIIGVYKSERDAIHGYFEDEYEKSYIDEMTTKQAEEKMHENLVFMHEYDLK